MAKTRPVIRNDLSIYDTFAAHWWDGSVRWLRTLQNLVPARLAHFDTIAAWPGKRVLDLGCGGGFMAEALAARGAEVTGIDPAAGAIAIATRHAAASGRKIRYLTGTGEAIPLADASLDIVVCVDVLEHVTDLDRVLTEVARVLKPGGLFLFDTINRTVLARLTIIWLGEVVLRLLPRGTHDSDKFIAPALLQAKLEALGFAVSRLAGLGPRGLDRRLDFTFGRVPTLQVIYMGHAIRH
jgi:2-polyprenyl-6-hydroxyphenyl methylase / 3-demethylubiquinone-9 3-methyltransferase